jgi:hypothetical protein
MKKAFLACWTLLTAVLLASCLSDDDEVTVYDDVAVTSMTLGTLNRYVTTTTSAGKDSLYRVAYAGSSVRLTIDQLGGRIFATDSLPVGTDLKHVVCTLVTKNSALVTLKSVTSDSLTVYSSTDSIDFTQPRVFRIFSTDGQHARDYTVTLAVRRQAAGVLRWSATDMEVDVQSVAIDPIDPARLDADASLVPQLSLDGVVWSTATGEEYTLWAGRCNESDTAMTLWRHIKDAGHDGLWTLMTQAEDNPYYLPAMEQVRLVYYQGVLLALGSNGSVYRSQDQGITWHTSSQLLMPDGFSGAPFSVVNIGGALWLKDSQGHTWIGRI